MLFLLVLMAFFMNGIQIYISYFSGYTFTGIQEKIFTFFCNYAHVALGCTLFFLMKKAFTYLLCFQKSEKISKICRITDYYSYDVYLVHHFFILGSFSLMEFTESLVFNIVVSVICIVIWPSSRGN